MNWLYTVTIILHVLLAAGIVGLVLLQRGRGADAGAGFGAGASGTVFGARGSASFLSRSTATLAGLFIATSLALAYLGSQRPSAPSSVTDRVTLPNEQPKPAVPLPSTGTTVPSPSTSAPPATQTESPKTTESLKTTDTPAAAASDPGPQQSNPQEPRQ